MPGQQQNKRDRKSIAMNLIEFNVLYLSTTLNRQRNSKFFIVNFIVFHLTFFSLCVCVCLCAVNANEVEAFHVVSIESTVIAILSIRCANIFGFF